MASHESKEQRGTVERVMHEYKEGELRTGGGKGPQQASPPGAPPSTRRIPATQRPPKKRRRYRFGNRWLITKPTAARVTRPTIQRKNDRGLGVVIASRCARPVAARASTKAVAA